MSKKSIQPNLFQGEELHKAKKRFSENYNRNNNCISNEINQKNKTNKNIEENIIKEENESEKIENLSELSNNHTFSNISKCSCKQQISITWKNSICFSILLAIGISCFLYFFFMKSFGNTNEIIEQSMRSSLIEKVDLLISKENPKSDNFYLSLHRLLRAEIYKEGLLFPNEVKLYFIEKFNTSYSQELFKNITSLFIEDPNVIQEDFPKTVWKLKP